MRRRLAGRGPFAGVRFETLPRLAELLGAGSLARAGLSPLARPIGDYVAMEVAHEARAALTGVRDLPGFARVLRQTFRRLRRGGFRRAEDISVPLDAGLLGEVVRLYGLYRLRTSPFYDDEDLMEGAATTLDAAAAPLAEELGEIYVVPPGALSAASEQLLKSLRRAVGARRFHSLPEPQTTPATQFTVAPDPASEAQETAREVLRALEAGTPLHEIAVLHGAAREYRTLVHDALTTAGVPVSEMPGTPLSETVAGRGVLMLAQLPTENYARTRVIDWLSLAPLRNVLPSQDGSVAWQPTTWRRLAREAGITQGRERWDTGLEALSGDLAARLQATGPEDETRRARYEEQRGQAEALRGLIAGLVARLEPLRQPQPAASFIQAFQAVVETYIDPRAAALPAVLVQIEQLGTIDKVGGRFSLESFAGALRANLDAAYHRQASLGDGVFVADYSLAAGLSFQHTLICGAYEGVFPVISNAEPLVDGDTWQALRREHPMLEDAALRAERARAQAQRAIATARQQLHWSAPLQAAGAGRDHYPAQLMLSAAREHDASLVSATDLRRASAAPWLRRPASPMAATLSGPPLDVSELRVRASLVTLRDGLELAPHHTLRPALAMLAARKSDRFGPYDGNLADFAGDAALFPRGRVAPTALEAYAACGFRYFLHAVLRLRPPEEPEDRDTMDAAERGTLVHEVLQTFFTRQKERGRPTVNERWTEADHTELLHILEQHLDDARLRGRTGLDIFAGHERRRLRADLSAFLEQDSSFRTSTGAVPTDFEVEIPAKSGTAIAVTGKVDRIDWTPNRDAAWVIDYKTGGLSSYDKMKPADPLAGGTLLQLPAYLAAASEAAKVVSMYWFISGAAKFARKEFDPTPENLERYQHTLDAILAGVQQGAFPAFSGEENSRFNQWDNCRYCDFDKLCSRRREDEFTTKGQDAALHPWLGVGQTARGETP